MEAIRPYSIENRVNWENFAERIDLYRGMACRQLDLERRSKMGQYFTPARVAKFMASLFSDSLSDIRLLDAGAGVGTLTAAFVGDIFQRERRPGNISVKAYEVEPLLNSYLQSTLTKCQQICQDNEVAFSGDVLAEDFIQAGVAMLRRWLFPVERFSFNRAILNPPYRKMRRDSRHRQLLSSLGIEASNLYTAFLAIAIELLEPTGELVAITPRSFCNGPYFKQFRKLFLKSMTLRRIHVFESRTATFQSDDVLQENIIFHAIKGAPRTKVLISSSHGPALTDLTLHTVDYEQVIKSNDPESMIHIIASKMDQFVLDRIGVFQNSLEELRMAVSTGRVVAFRAKEFLRDNPNPDTAPLIYPNHFENGLISWPRNNGKKPNALIVTASTESMLLPAGNYVLVKRFSAKEEPRRIMAAICDPDHVPAPQIGFENHLNVYHRKNAGLPIEIAKGLAVFLNSTLVDSYFRQFSGHTQVNATDLRTLPYPNRQFLETLGAMVTDQFPSQREIDRLLEKEINKMAIINSPDPVAAKQKIEAAVEILQALGLPKGQHNERSALTLLALLALKPEMRWDEITAPRIGITPIMTFCRDYYGKEYAPNTRETFRRRSMHQFIAAGLAIPNPDNPNRPVNSPHYCYQVEPAALKLLKTYGTEVWTGRLHQYLNSVETLQKRYARAREMRKIPVTLAEGTELYLTPGAHSQLVKAIIEEFAPRFVPGGEVIYVGDTGNKWRYFDEDALRDLGVTMDLHGKMPDVVIHHLEKDWLILIEAVTSHGPVDSQRRAELATLFAAARPGLVYVTAFLTRNDTLKYLNDISWETEVWVRETASHLIHFNGERFLGPYEE